MSAAKRLKYENDGRIIWFKSTKANGFAWLSNFFPDVLPAAFNKLPDEIKACSGSFVVDGVKYRTVEHFFQSKKYSHMPEVEEDIRSAPTAAEAKKRNTRHKHAHPIDVKAWEGGKAEEMMEIAIFAKFSQNPPLLKALLETEGQDLREICDRSDSKWTGDMKHRGLLGEILIRVRKRLLREQKPKEAPPAVEEAPQ